MFRVKIKMELKLHDERSDINDYADEVDDEELNRAITEIVHRYTGAGSAGSDGLMVEIDFEAKTMRVLSREELS